MANIVRLKRSSTSGNVPTSLQDGEVAVQQADGIFFWRNAGAAIQQFLFPRRYAVSDAAYTVKSTDTYVGISSLTASRVITLPTASSYPVGQILTIADESQSCSSALTITLSRSGSDTINAATSIVLVDKGFSISLASDGSSKWTTTAIGVLLKTGDGSGLTVTPTGGTQVTLPNALALASQSDAATGTATTGLMTPDLTRRNVIAQAGNTTLAVGGVTSAYLSKIAYGQAPVLDMFGPYRDGVNGDETLINAILNGHNALQIRPSWNGVGPVLVKSSPIVVPPNAKIKSLGGRQIVNITRPSGYNGDTLQMGSSNTGMGSAEIEGLWFTQPGRFIGQVTSGTTLPGGPLTNGSAHIRAYGSQFGGIRNCGGWGMPYFIAQHGGYALTIENLMTIGGIWDRTATALQESIAVLGTFYDPVHGYPACTTVSNPNWVGGNISSETRSVPLYSKSYSCKERIGPKYGWLHAAGEDCRMIGGFSGGFNRSNIAIIPAGAAVINGNPSWVQIGFEVHSSYIDESMWAGIEVYNGSSSYSPNYDISVRGCKFNGQLIGAHGIDISPSQYMGVSQLQMSDNRFAAYQGAGVRLYAVDGALITNTMIRGYNYAGFDTTKNDPIDYGSGLIVGGISKNVITSNVRLGGGANTDSDANLCQWGYVDTTPVASNGQSQQNNTYRVIRATTLQLAGGGITFGGQNDISG